MDLIAELVRRQAGEPDEQFAARLGITRMAWRFIKNGDNDPGRKALAGIGRAYPDLRKAARDYWLSKIDSPHAKADSEQASETVK